MDKLPHLDIVFVIIRFVFTFASLGSTSYRCQGHHYEIEDSYHATQYIVVPVGSMYSVGDLVIGESTAGFIETVIDVREDAYAMMYHTQRTRCHTNMDPVRYISACTCVSLIT